MNNIKLLDCTLRDGGYLNDWEFGHSNLISILERLVNARVDIIEIGFLDERRIYDVNRSIMPSTDCVEKIYGKIDKKNAMVVGMIDYGTCSLKQIQPRSQSYLDGIRVIFKKHLMHEALHFCAQIKSLGYNVFAQMVSITSYSNEELDAFIRLANKIKPYAVSMVDTYGLLYRDNFLHYFEYLDNGLDPEIQLGYHSHNNFQLAYSNCMEALRQDTKRDLLIDATLYGMGKSAGNAPLELVAMHMNENYGKNYDMAQILETIDGNIMKIYQDNPWGYNLFFYLAASNNCHPNYVKFLMDKHTLAIKSVNLILASIDSEKKLLYDREHIECLYCEYLKRECNDEAAHKELYRRFSGKTVLILGPGSSLLNYKEKIRKFIDETKPLVISINFIPENYPVDYVFLSNPRRYIHLLNCLKEAEKKVPIIATSNVTETQGRFDFTLNNEALMDTNAKVKDYSFVMLLKALKDKGITKIYCAGLDGYSENGSNYANPDMEYWFARRNAPSLNSYVRNYLNCGEISTPISFLTPSYYEILERSMHE